MDKLNETTYTREVNSNPKDRIEVEVGDSKQPDFKPQFKLMRWDNEVNFSMRAEEHPDAVVEEDGGVIKYKTPQYEVHQYEKPDAGEDGGFEFEWILKEKPDTNILTATIQTKNLRFSYQPALTQEEIDEGVSQQENVTGSYAVYHTTNRDNKAGGMEYKAGKAFHIYRPRAVDAIGKEVWCELYIDEEVLTVAVPQVFLNEAVYPVVVDPTFGYTSIGGTSLNIANKLFSNWRSGRQGNDYAAPSGGTLDSMTVYGSGTLGTTLFVAVNGLDSVGSNSHGEVASATGAVGSSAEWNTIDLSGESITGGNTYVISVAGSTVGFGDSDTYACYYDLDATVDGFFAEGFTDAVQATAFSNAQEDPWTVSRNVGQDRRASIYVTYTESASGPSNLKTYNTNLKANIKTINGNPIANCKSLNTNV